MNIPATLTKLHDKNLLLDENGVRLRRCRHGLMLYPNHDMYVGRSLDVYGEYMQSEMDLFAHFVKPGTVVLDIGGNLGASAVPLARFVGDTGRVFSFEPQRLCFAFLQANIALNNLHQLSAYYLAMGEKSGRIKVPYLNTQKTINLGGLSVADSQKGEIVTCTTLDSFTLPRCDFIKIDVEGMEIDTLKGGANFIAKHRPILFVEDDRADKSAALRKLLCAYDYRLYFIHTPIFNPQNYFSVADNIFTVQAKDGRRCNVVCVNLLCIPKENPAICPQMPLIKATELPPM